MSGRNRNLSQSPIFEQKTVAELDAMVTAYVATDPDTVRIGQAYICSDEAGNANMLVIFDGTNFKVATDGLQAV